MILIIDIIGVVVVIDNYCDYYYDDNYYLMLLVALIIKRFGSLNNFVNLMLNCLYIELFGNS